MKIEFRFSFSGSIFYATIILGLLLFCVPPAWAKANFSKIVISGGDLTSAVEVTDPALPDFFSFSDFPTAGITKPKNIHVSDGYIVSRGWEENDLFTAWDSLFYFPKDDGTGGYVYYEGLINGWSEYDGKWYLASAEGDAAMRRLLRLTDSRSPQPSHPSKSWYLPL